MLIAHLADLHLGFRAYHRVNPRGVNVREADVAEAFRETVQKVVDVRPDLVLIAGDVFHTVRPSNASIADAFRQLASITRRLPGVPVIIIAGNHDSPRSVDTGNILTLFREIPNVYAVTEEAERIPLPDRDASVFCIPHNALARGEDPVYEPDPSAKVNILMLHGSLTGQTADAKISYISEYGGAAVDDSSIGADRWDYVALGHHHTVTDLAPNMWYAGGIERTSTNIWAEMEEKGFVTYDTDRGAAEFHAVPTRPVVDLKRLSAKGLTAAEIDSAVERAVQSVPGGLEGKIARMVIFDIPRHLVRELDHKRIRDYKAEALHFHLDPRSPQVQRIVESAPMRRQSLREQVETYVGKHWTPSSESIDRERLVTLARGYMDAVGEGDE